MRILARRRGRLPETLWRNDRFNLSVVGRLLLRLLLDLRPSLRLLLLRDNESNSSRESSSIDRWDESDCSVARRWPGATFNTTWKYEWKSYLAPKVSTSFRFFHLMQVLRRDACGGQSRRISRRTLADMLVGPVFTLDALNGRVTIVDNIRECKKLGTCPSTPIEFVSPPSPSPLHSH